MRRSRTAAVAQVRRARLILMLDGGASRSAIKHELRCDSRFISTWGRRFAQERLSGLFAHHPGRTPKRDGAEGTGVGLHAQAQAARRFDSLEQTNGRGCSRCRTRTNGLIPRHGFP